MARVGGDPTLMANFAKLERAAGMRAIDDAMRAALEPLRKETKIRAPRNALKRGVVIRKVNHFSKYRREFWVAFLRGKAMQVAHLVEFGTAPHSLAKGASRRRAYMQDRPPFHPGTRPHPFFRPAYEATKDEVEATAGERLWSLLLTQITR